MVEDISIGKASDKAEGFGLSEAELSGHIANAHSNGKINSDKPTLDETSLLHEDYQLYAALTILKGLVVQQQ